ncbi:MAG: hypothetical protein ACRC0G_02245, partial [Fusobacteriaceae bacterium]
MVIGDKIVNDILRRLSLKLNIPLDEEITLNEIMKKVQNQNLNYQNHDTEIDLLDPCFKNGFFVRNCELVYDKVSNVNFDHSMVIGAKFLSKKIVQLKDLYGKKLNVTHDVESGDYVKVKVKEVPL